MWKPVSKLDYLPLASKGQIIVVTCLLLKRDDEIRDRWKDRACAVIGDSGGFVRDVVRDLLANPQVRSVVFDGPVCCREAYAAFWSGTDTPAWQIGTEHLNLVRQFVDLFDDDCNWRAPPQPFWPARIMYLDEEPKCV